MIALAIFPYKDGDIVETFSNERILDVYAQEVCNVSKFSIRSHNRPSFK